MYGKSLKTHQEKHEYRERTEWEQPVSLPRLEGWRKKSIEFCRDLVEKGEWKKREEGEDKKSYSSLTKFFFSPKLKPAQKSPN